MSTRTIEKFTRFNVDLGNMCGGMPFRWDSKKNKIVVPLNRKDVLVWTVAATYQLIYTMFVIFRAVSSIDTEMDSVSRLRSTAVIGMCLTFSFIHIYYIMRRTELAEMVNTFLESSKHMERK